MFPFEVKLLYNTFSLLSFKFSVSISFNCIFYEFAQATGRAEKFTFEVKWYISLHDIIILSEGGPDTYKEASPPNLVILKSQASTVRDQLRRQEKLQDSKGVSISLQIN